MTKTIFTIIVLFIFLTGTAQTSKIRYFKNEWLGEEVKQDKARFSETVTQNADGTITTEIKNLKKSEIVRSQTFKGNEPYGVWISQRGNGLLRLDYNFPLVYSEEKCSDTSSFNINDIFKDNDTIAYKAPVLNSGEMTIYQFIAKNLVYPQQAMEEGIQGTVYLILSLTKEGNVENVIVLRGVNIFLDKEAVRVVKQLKFSSPAKINGTPHAFPCLSLPLRYWLK